MPAGYCPSELAQMPDGRLLVQGRRFGRTGFYKAITVTREADGSQLVWLVSDSNEMVLLQRTLVLKLRIGPEARSAPAR
jgi:hypothetical protein